MEIEGYVVAIVGTNLAKVCPIITRSGLTELYIRPIAPVCVRYVVDTKLTKVFIIEIIKLSERFGLRANDDNYGIKSELWSKLSTVLLVSLNNRALPGRCRAIYIVHPGDLL